MIKAAQYGAEGLSDAKVLLTDEEKALIPPLKVNKKICNFIDFIVLRMHGRA